MSGWWNCFVDLVVEYPEAVIAGCALFVSIVTAAIAIWQAIIQRRHNRLSVRPIIDTYNGTELNRSCAFPDGTVGQALQQEVKLRNIGLGPALITKYQVLLDGQELDTHDQSLIDRTVQGLFGPRIVRVAFFRMGGVFGLQAGSNLSICQLVVPAPTDADVDAQRATFARFDVVVEGKSVYGDPVSHDTRKDVPRRVGRPLAPRSPATRFGAIWGLIGGLFGAKQAPQRRPAPDAAKGPQ